MAVSSVQTLLSVRLARVATISPRTLVSPVHRWRDAASADQTVNVTIVLEDIFSVEVTVLSVLILTVWFATLQFVLNADLDHFWSQMAVVLPVHLRVNLVFSATPLNA